MLLPSVLGFALCFVCLAATTWAWFVVSVTSDSNTIQTASFDVEVYLDGSTTPVAADANGDYTLSTGKYIVKMSKTGDANGYFDFKVGEKQYRTTAITANTPITITIENTGASSIICSFTSSWGTPDGTTVGNGEPVTFNAVLPPEIISITDGDTIIVGEPSEDPADETQQEEEQENQQQEEKEETSSNEQETPDDPENNGEGESKPDTPAEGEGEQPSDPANGENGQQGDEPSTPTDGEQGGEQTDVSGDTTDGDIGDDTITGGESPTDTTTPAGGDVPTEPVVTTDPTAQSEGGAPADPVATE